MFASDFPNVSEKPVNLFNSEYFSTKKAGFLVLLCFQFNINFGSSSIAFLQNTGRFTNKDKLNSILNIYTNTCGNGIDRGQRNIPF